MGDLGEFISLPSFFNKFFVCFIIVTTVHILTTSIIYDQYNNKDMAGGPTGTPNQVCLSLHL